MLIVARLTVRSSYADNREEPAGADCDTVQFYVPAGGGPIFRVRTFALDRDIHIHRIDGWPDDPASTIRAHLLRTYKDVTASITDVPLRQLSTQDLTDAGLSTGRLVAEPELGFAFWSPGGEHYATISQPVAGDGPHGLQEVVYLGGIARFWVPATWEIEMDAEVGGCFYDPEGDGVLRLNVLTFETSAAAQPPVFRTKRKPGERAIDGGTLPNGCEFDVYETDFVEDDQPVRMRFWQIGQALAGQARVYLFSYAYPVAAEEELADELAAVDREIRRMIPYPDPV